MKNKKGWIFTLLIFLIMGIFTYKYNFKSVAKLNNQIEESIIPSTISSKPITSKNSQGINDNTKVNNVNNTNSISSQPNLTESLHNDLIGQINNNFGIRDDILYYIFNTIPKSDQRSTLAAIKMAKFDQAQIGITDDKVINKLANKSAAASYCIDLENSIRVKFGHGYDELLRNTASRQLEQARIEKLLSDHVILPDFGAKSEDNNRQKQCNTLLGIK